MDTMLKLWRKQCWRIIFFVSFAIACSPSILYAQNASVPTAAIVYSMGGDFVLTRQDGSRNTYDPNYISQNAILLQNADYIQTTSGVFVEIMVNPGGTSIILAENTSMVFESTGSGPGAPNVVSLVYGRIRVSQKRATLTTIVRAGTSIIEIENGTVNSDFIVPPESTDSQLTLYISAMSGNAVFIPYVASPENARIRVRQRETVIFYPGSNKIDRQPMNKAIVSYWASRTGKKNANASRRTLEPPNADKIVSVFADPDPSYSGKAAYLKTRFLIAGVLTVTAGVAVQGFAYFSPSLLTDDISTVLFAAGYAPLGLGIFMLLAAYFY